MTEQVTKAMGGIEKPVNQSRVFIITESHLEPYLNLETEKVATVTEVIKLNINARSEEHLKHIFDNFPDRLFIINNKEPTAPLMLLNIAR